MRTTKLNSPFQTRVLAASALITSIASADRCSRSHSSRLKTTSKGNAVRIDVLVGRIGPRHRGALGGGVRDTLRLQPRVRKQRLDDLRGQRPVLQELNDVRQGGKEGVEVALADLGCGLDRDRSIYRG